MDDSAEAWSDFFISAGIPVTVADNYAVTFSQHRIRIDMLREITKDILIDMGIKAMGDIIAILRHAKNLSQQDELRSDAAKTTSLNKLSSSVGPPGPRQTSNQTSALSSSSVRQHLSQRTPITTSSRPGSNISSLVGNKIQSRLNLSSGALLSSSNNGSISSNKRLSSSTISNSLSKRLKGAEQSKTVRDLPEKTLTVHYPSSSAIARAQQRISGVPAATTTTTPSSSIKSRLGSAMTDNGTFRSHASNNNNNSISRNNNNSYQKDSVQKRNRSHSREARPRRDLDMRRQNSRPKSTVFSRLGETSTR